MTDTPATPPDDQQPPTDTVEGGGPSAAEQLANDPVRQAAAKLELLSEETREQVLSRMDPAIAQRVRDMIVSMAGSRPHNGFSTDVATRRRMIHEMADGVASRTVAQTVDSLDALAPGAASPTMATPGLSAPAAGAQPGGVQRPASSDPLEALRTLHPAAIARAMQGERAEAWAIVLDRLDANARAALQLYLDGTARTAIEEARARQAELQATSPALLGTIIVAIARTVVPRALREHNQLLTTSPMAWSGA